MEIDQKTILTPKLKSSNILEHLFKCRREVNRRFSRIRICNNQSTSPKGCSNDLGYELSQSNDARICQEANFLTPANNAQVQELLIDNINRAIEKKRFNVLKTNRISLKPYRTFIVEQVRQNKTPEYFRKALHTVLKVPEQKITRIKKKK